MLTARAQQSTCHGVKMGFGQFRNRGSTLRAAPKPWTIADIGCILQQKSGGECQGGKAFVVCHAIQAVEEQGIKRNCLLIGLGCHLTKARHITSASQAIGIQTKRIEGVGNLAGSERASLIFLIDHKFPLHKQFACRHQRAFGALASAR